MAPYFPVHYHSYKLRPEARPDEARAPEPRPSNFGRDEADALKRMGIVLIVIALFLFLVAMVGR